MLSFCKCVQYFHKRVYIMTRRTVSRMLEDIEEENLVLVPSRSQNSEFGFSLRYLRSASRNQGEQPILKANNVSRQSQLHEQQLPSLRSRVSKKRQPQISTKTHEEETLQYEKYTFDDKIRRIINRIATITYHSFRDRSNHPALGFYLERILCGLSKKLLLNKFQLLFLEYVLEETKCRYQTQLISQIAPSLKPYSHIYESQDTFQLARNVQIYLLFCAYYAKKSLNDIEGNPSYNKLLNSIIPNFKARFQEWIESEGFTKMIMNVKVFNSIFKKLTTFTQREKDYYQNYNLIVEETLEISPSYNPDKEKRKKKKKTEEESAEIERIEQRVARQVQLNTIRENQQEPAMPAVTLRRRPTSTRSYDNDFSELRIYRGYS